jgi:cyclopropane-fatty-acyl-phospholipid synthase
MDSGMARLSRPLQKVLHALNRNTRKGSRKNIAAHYDLGNDFYSIWLDPTMMYSSAYFDRPDTPLEEAAIEKLDRICRKLELSQNDSVMEIGTGWGGFAIHAATHYGCHVTTTTISQQQHDFASKAIADAGLQDKITLLLQDYRDLVGSFDKLVSIEMIEAVGHEYHDTFFRKCCDLLKPDGQMLLQAITIADPDMRVIHLEDIGPHYATTLRHWRNRFFAQIDKVRQLAYSEEFIRMWEFYLCYCESAFVERVIGDVQMLVVRPSARRNRIEY